MRLLLSFSLISFLNAASEKLPPLPVNLTQVKMGAYWEKGEASGFVRFSTFENGYDNIWHRVVLEWIQSPDSAQAVSKVISRVALDKIPKVWSVGDAKFVREGGKNLIRFKATNSYAPENTSVFTIELLGVGEYKVTKK